MTKKHFLLFCIFVPLVAIFSLRYFGNVRIHPNECCDFNRVTPKAFLETLVENAESGSIVTRVSAPPKDWVKQIDLPKLVEVLDSEQPCTAVFLPHSSYFATQKSNVGYEAAQLVQFYRTGRYISGLKDMSKFDIDKDEIRNWFKNKR